MTCGPFSTFSKFGCPFSTFSQKQRFPPTFLGRRRQISMFLNSWERDLFDGEPRKSISAKRNQISVKNFRICFKKTSKTSSGKHNLLQIIKLKPNFRSLWTSLYSVLAFEEEKFIPKKKKLFMIFSHVAF